MWEKANNVGKPWWRMAKVTTLCGSLHHNGRSEVARLPLWPHVNQFG
jgi:hypothetical protein